MTEAEWMECNNPESMLGFLNERDASARKFRLFSSVCARRLWLVMSGDRARTVVLDAERFAEGLLSERERRKRQEEFRATFPPRMTPDEPVPPSYLADMVAFYAIWSNSIWDPSHTLHLNEHGANCVSAWVGRTLVLRETDDWEASWPPSKHSIGRAEADLHCRLIRDMFGNSFRLNTLDPSWRTSLVRALAQATYNERSFPEGTLDPDRLAVLADAMEDAGCDNADILNHLRSPGPHVCGCWALDLLLGKE